ncbi:hypothetical protein ACQR1I_36230 [Bradyrhizobium sp. HKCCYLS2038]|uniref:hypothetical protein n=1 Tax=Bradyrhizobium sp. HKCCYLS2038 TaxID=3420764 RepID=UPI003EB81245
MSALNIGILIAFVLGAAALLASFKAGKSVSFYDGSFLVQIALMAVGVGLMAAALVIKFIASLFG